MYDSLLRFLLLAAIYATGLLLLFRPWQNRVPGRAPAAVRRKRG